MQELRENVALAPLTTFQIGGPARYFVEVSRPEEIKEAIEYAHNHTMRFVLLSGGSNVLVPDEGLDALVIHVLEGEHVFTENVLSADAGCNLLNLIKAASAQHFGGWEKLAGIPGSIGGAVRGNAGAFGSEIKDFLTVVHTFNSKTLEAKSSVHPYMTFSYRDSSFKQNPELIITSVTIELMLTKREQSEKLIEETIAEREKRHLQNVRAAGSFFMNPIASAEIVALFEREKKTKSREGRVPAGWLIEKAGMKGAQVGGAIASEQHPNYLVNTGNASAKDVLALAGKIKAAVQAQFNIELHEEAAIL
jgi:UDP-N-acetylmuramate dehydrogenase